MLALHPYSKSAEVWSCGVLLFAVCAGYFPFRDLSLIEKIKGEEPAYLEFFSEELVALLRAMLENNQLNRISPEMALKHPWVAKESIPTSFEALSNSIEKAKRARTESASGKESGAGGGGQSKQVALSEGSANNRSNEGQASGNAESKGESDAGARRLSAGNGGGGQSEEVANSNENRVTEGYGDKCQFTQASAGARPLPGARVRTLGRRRSPHRAPSSQTCLQPPKTAPPPSRAPSSTRKSSRDARQLRTEPRPRRGRVPLLPGLAPHPPLKRDCLVLNPEADEGHEGSRRDVRGREGAPPLQERLQRALTAQGRAVLHGKAEGPRPRQQRARRFVFRQRSKSLAPDKKKIDFV